MTQSGKAFPITRIVRRDEVPDGGLDVSIEADRETCEALARFADIPNVESFSVHLTVSPWRRRGLSVRGRLDASVVQTCVVTLEPVRGEVAEEVAVNFVPEERTGRAPSPEEVVDPDAEDTEPLIGERIDLGALAVEHFVLGLDPYPRCPGVVFEAETEEEAGQDNAFARLAALRERKRDD